MAENCIFCSIVAGSVPAYIVARNHGAVAFLDAHPIAPAHCVVVPVRHRESVDDLLPEEIDGVFLLVQQVTRATKRALGAPAATVAVNDGAAAGQVVPHTHVHIIPRFVDDGGTSIHSIVHNPSDRPFVQFVEEIKSYLDPSILKND